MGNLLRVATKLLRDTTMGKPTKKPRGKSARHGNAPSPYTKYKKSPYVYSTAYQAWRRDRLAGRTPAAVASRLDDWKRDKREEFKLNKAAE